MRVDADQALQWPVAAGICELNRAREQFIRSELRAMKTHRLNVYLEMREPVYVVREPLFRDPFRPVTVTVTQEMRLCRHKPAGWVAPLP